VRVELLFGGLIVLALLASALLLSLNTLSGTETTEINVSISEVNTSPQQPETPPAEEAEASSYRVLATFGSGEIASAQIFDVDGDGTGELLLVSKGENGVRVQLMDGGTIILDLPAPEALAWKAVPLRGAVALVSTLGTEVYSPDGELLAELNFRYPAHSDGEHILFLNDGSLYVVTPTGELVKTIPDVELAFLRGSAGVLVRDGGVIFYGGGCDGREAPLPENYEVLDFAGYFEPLQAYVLNVTSTQDLSGGLLLLTCDGNEVFYNCEMGVADVAVGKELLVFACNPTEAFATQEVVWVISPGGEERYPAGGAVSVAVGDSDGDGREEPLYYSSTTGLLYNGSYIDFRSFLLSDAVDVDADGVDEAVGLSGRNVVIVDGSPVYVKVPTEDDLLYYVGSGDVTGNGSPDVVVLPFYFRDSLYVIGVG